MKTTVILNQTVGANGTEVSDTLKVGDVKLKVTGTTLKQFRADLKKYGFTEVSTIYRGGKHVVTFITMVVKEIVLADSGLIRGNKAIRTELKRLNTSYDNKLKFNMLGYSF